MTEDAGRRPAHPAPPPSPYMRTIQFYDCTLRDGAQGPGINFSLMDKVRLAEALDAFGVDYIEGGWPGANPKDTEFFRHMAGHPLRHAQLVAFGATCRGGVMPSEDPQVQALMSSQCRTVSIFGKSWLLHVREVLKVSPEENLRMIFDTVRHLHDAGRRVFFDAEHFFDGFADAPEYAMAALQSAVDGGAMAVVLCDTNGATLPYDINRIAAEVRSKLPSSVMLGIHCHNDSDCAVASSLTAVRAGCDLVEGTVNGFGERCGNADLCSIIPAVAFKMAPVGVAPSLRLPELTALSRLFYEIAVLHERPQQPYVGSGAFAHKGGMHVNAVAKDSRTFEQISPESVGNRRHILLSELSGVSNVVLKARELGVRLEDGGIQARAILAEIKRREAQGYAFEAADASFKLLVERLLERHQPLFELDGFRVIIEKRGPNEKCLSEATIKVRVKGQTALTAAEGEGPVNALDLALRKALTGFFPKVGNMRLRDFKVRILDGADGTAAQTRVLIDSSDGTRDWGTVGMSENIIEASWQALLDSVEYYLGQC